MPSSSSSSSSARARARTSARRRPARRARSARPPARPRPAARASSSATRVAERRAAVGDRRLRPVVVGRRGGVAGPAVDVAAHPERRARARAAARRSRPARRRTARSRRRASTARAPAARASSSTASSAARLPCTSYRTAITAGVYSIGAVPAPAPLTVTGPTLTLRYAEPTTRRGCSSSAPTRRVTRFFSWGPVQRVEEPLAYIAGLAGKRERGELLEFLIDHHEHGPIGVTGLSELCRARPPRHRRAPGSAATTGAPAPTPSPRRWSRRWLRDARAGAPDRVGEHPQRPLAARARARRLPPRGRAARAGIATATRSTTSWCSGCCARPGRPRRCATCRRSVEGTPPAPFVLG